MGESIAWACARCKTWVLHFALVKIVPALSEVGSQIPFNYRLRAFSPGFCTRGICGLVLALHPVCCRPRDSFLHF